jgi:SOS-response transcriptional repressor LexA
VYSVLGIRPFFRHLRTASCVKPPQTLPTAALLPRIETALSRASVVFMVHQNTTVSCAKQELIVAHRRHKLHFMVASSKQDFAERLTEACIDAGMSSGRGMVTELHKRVRNAGMNISFEGVRKWVEGESIPSMNNARMLASVVGRSVEYLLSGRGGKYPTQSVEGNVLTGPDMRGRVPLISWTQAGDFASLVDNYHPGDGEEWVKTTVPVKKHTFALRVVGDSMEPEFPEGTVIVVEPDMQADPGDFVVVRANGGLECTFKQLMKDGNDWYLKPINDRYPIKPMPKDAVIIGVVRSQEKRYK